MSVPRNVTTEQVAFIRDSIQKMSTRACARAFTERFGEPLGQTQLRRIMAQNEIAASVKRNDFSPIGTERYSRYYDCIIVKVNDYHCEKGASKTERNKNRDRNWKMKQNLIWEQTAGKPLPWRWVVVFLDGNRMNYSPDNLYAVPLQVVGTIEKMRMHSENPEVYKTALIWGQLYFTLKEVNGRAIAL